MAGPFQNSCRTCLAERSPALLLKFSDPNVLDLLKFTALQTQVDDPLPQQICVACYTRCLDWNSFFEMAVRSDQFLRDALSGNSGSVEQPIESIPKRTMTVKSIKIEKDKDCDSVGEKQDHEVAEKEMIERINEILAGDAVDGPEKAQVNQLSDGIECPTSSWPNQCQPCNLSFIAEWELDSHMSSIQYCPDCTEEFQCLGIHPHVCDPYLAGFKDQLQPLRGKTDRESKKTSKDLVRMRMKQKMIRIYKSNARSFTDKLRWLKR